MPKLTIAEVTNKTTKSGKPYLNIKSSTGKFYNCWQDYQYIWHLIKAGETIEPIMTQEGNFPPSITGVVGLEGENATTAIIEPKNGTPNAWDKLFMKLDRIEASIDFLVDETKIRKELERMDKLPKLEDLPIHNLEDGI